MQGDDDFAFGMGAYARVLFAALGDGVAVASAVGPDLPVAGGDQFEVEFVEWCFLLCLYCRPRQ